MPPAFSLFGFDFQTPSLLFGMLAALIPIVLHFIARIRARVVEFPTLRFLRLSIEKTARRRKIQNLLLLVLRCLLMAIFAVAVSEPISRAANPGGDGDRAAVIIIDNSFSMSSSAAGRTSFDRARASASELLYGEDKPQLASVMTTAGTGDVPPLSRQLGAARRELEKATIGFGASRLDARIATAAEMLKKHGSMRKSIYLFTDLQENDIGPFFEAVTQVKDAGITIYTIRSAAEKKGNVSVKELRIQGRNIVDSAITFSAIISNSSGEIRDVEVMFRPDANTAVTKTAMVNLAARGQDGHTAELRFTHTYDSPGHVAGQVQLNIEDDIGADNIRRFTLEIFPRCRALVIGGPDSKTGGWWFAPAGMLRMQLDWRSADGSRAAAWPIESSYINHDEFTPAQLEETDAAFFCEVPSIDSDEAKALASFVGNGGTAVMFLGPGIDTESYKKLLFIDGKPFLPADIGTPVGEIAPDSPAVPVAGVKIDHPCFKGLFDEPEEYLQDPILIRRRFPLQPAPGAEVLLTLEGGHPLLVANEFGTGTIILCGTPDSLRWSTNLPTHGIFVPFIIRAALLRQRTISTVGGITAGQPATIRLGAEDEFGIPRTLLIAPPDTEKTQEIETGGKRTIKYDRTGTPGIYRWKDIQARQQGMFAVNVYGPEGENNRLSTEQTRKGLAARAVEHTFVGNDVREAAGAARAASAGQNWWDLVLLVVILVLIFESLVSNRTEEEAPAAPTPAEA